MKTSHDEATLSGEVVYKCQAAVFGLYWLMTLLACVLLDKQGDPREQGVDCGSDAQRPQHPQRLPGGVLEEAE